MQLLKSAILLGAASFPSRQFASGESTLSARSIEHLKALGMKTNDIQNWTSNMMRSSFMQMKKGVSEMEGEDDEIEEDEEEENPSEAAKEKDQEKEKQVAQEKKAHKNKLVCGEGHQGLLELILDNNDFDAKSLVLGQLSKDKITFFSGSNVEKEYDLKDVILPVLTIDDKCFAMKQKDDFGTILCGRNLKNRNEWLNYLHEAILCKQTGVKGRLPEEPGNALEVAEVKVEQEPVEEEPSGINIHIGDSPDGVKPAIVINGMTVGEITNLQRSKAVADVMPLPPKPSITDFPNPAADTDPDVPTLANALGEPKSQEEIDATNEAMAEQRQIPLDDERVPKSGYASHTMNDGK